MKLHEYTGACVHMCAIVWTEECAMCGDVCAYTSLCVCVCIPVSMSVCPFVHVPLFGPQERECMVGSVQLRF